MRRRGIRGRCARQYPVIGCLVALALFAAPAAADPAVSTTTSFTAADGARGYMDVGGAWDGTTDVATTGNGDVFTAALTNADNTPPEAANDLTLGITLPTGFIYQTGTPLFATLSGAGCGTAPTVQVTDNGGSLAVDFDDSGGAEAYNLPNDCAVTVQFELLADIGANAGSNLVRFDWNYTNGGPVQASQAVDVRFGDSALAVQPLTQTSTGPGDLVSWDITVTNEGNGGLYAVDVDDSSINNNPSVGLELQEPLTVVSAPRGVSIPNPPGDVARIPYLAPGESYTVHAVADVQSCSNLNNEVVTRNKVLPSPDPISAQVLLDLQNPQLGFDSTITGNLDYSGPATFTMGVSNSGPGTAFDVQVQTNLGTSSGPAVVVVSTSSNWTYAGAGLFRFTGDTGAGAGNLGPGDSATLTVELEPSDVCSDTGGGTVEYEPSYRNVCGTNFASPTTTSTLGGAQPVPSTGVAKSSSVAQLGIGSGDSASYTIDFTAANTSLIQDGQFTVSDVLPSALGTVTGFSASNGNGSVSCPGGTCDPGEQLTWTIANPGSGGAGETLTVDFTAPDNACLGGTTLTNTATVQDVTSTQSCTVSGGSDGAGIALANVPDPQNSDAFSFSVTGGPFETGQVPVDGDCTQDTGEGECIPHQAVYQFPAGYPGIWRDGADGDSTFTDDFGGIAVQEVVQGTVEVNLLEAGSSVTGGYVPVPAGSVTDGTGQLVLDLGFFADAGFYDDNNVASTVAAREIRIRYSTAMPDSALGGADTLGVGATSELLIKNGSGGSGACSNTVADPADAQFTIPTGFQVQRATADVSVTRTDGVSTADVCEVMPVRIAVDNGNGQQAADLLTQLAMSGTDYQYQTSPAPTYGGQFSGSFLNYDPGASGGPTWAFSDQAAELTGGTIDVQVQLLPGAPTGFGAGTPLAANTSYDDNQTTLSPSVGGTATSGRAFSDASGSFTPNEVRKGDLSIVTTPQQLFVTGDRVQWTIFLVNGGSGSAYNVRLQNDIPDQLGLDVAATNAVGNACGGTPVDATNPSGDLLQWDIPEVPAATTCEVTVVADVTPTTGCSIPDGSNRIAGEWGCASTEVQQGDLTGPYSNPLADNSPNFIFAEPELRLEHQTAYCELCDPTGRVVLDVRNIGNSRIQNVEVTEDLPDGVGVDLVPGSVEYSLDGGGTWQSVASAPQSLGNGQYRFTQAQIPAFAELLTPSESNLADTSTSPPHVVGVLIRYNVTSDESTLPGPQAISVSGQGDRPCDGQTFTFGPRQDLLDVHKPDITVTKTGDNLDRVNDGTAERVVGIPGETIEWTIQVTNNGDYYTRQSRLRDILVGEINRTSPSDSVILRAGPDGPSSDVDITNLGDAYTALDGGSFTGIAPGDTATYTIDETLGTSCFNADNQADFTWGCAANPSGAPSNLSSPSDNTDTARLLMVPDFSADDAIQQSLTPLPGGRTQVTLTLRNDGAPANDMAVLDDLPADMRIDTSIPATVSGSGMSFDQYDATLDAGETNGDPGTPNHPRIMLNGSLDFGQTTTVTFQAIQAGAFDTASDPFTDPETAPGLDPDPPATGTNDVFIEFSNTAGCTSITPPPSSDSVVFDPQTPDIDFDSVSPARAVVADGDTRTFTFTITNNGDLQSLGRPVEFRLDQVGSGWTNVSVAVTTAGNGGTGGSCDSSPPYTCDAARIGELRRGDQAVIEVTATANDNGGPLTLVGTAEGSVIEADGTDTGDNYSFDRIRPIVVGFELSKTLTGTSEPYTPDDLANNTADVTVGEEASWDLRARWFGVDTGAGEAVRNVQLRDSLDTRTGFVSRVDNSTGVTVTAANDPGTVNSGNVDFQLADISSGGGGTFLDDLTARLLNIGATSKGDTVPNAFDATFDVDYGGGHVYGFSSAEFGGSDAELSASADLQVAEPSIAFTKEVRNDTRGTAFQDADPPDRIPTEGADVLTYRVRITNTATGSNDAPAFGLIVDDVLATDKIRIDSGSLGVDLNGDDIVDVNCGQYTAGPPDEVAFDSNNCSFGATGTNLVRLDPGQTITLLYRGTVQGTANPREIMDNDAQLTDAWSLSDPAGNRTHQGNQSSGLEGTKGASDGARNYADSNVAGAIIENNTAVTKTVVSDTSPYGDGGDGEPDIRVGDGLTYEVVINLAPQSTINNFTVDDALPPGFEFTGNVSSFQTTDLSFDGSPSAPAPGDTTHTWNFGTVVVTGDNPELRFDYDVVTVDADPDGSGNEVILPPGDSSNQANAATLTFDTGSGSGTFSATAQAPVDVLQPDLTVAKTSNPAPPDRVGESDTVTYTVTVQNTTQGTAYDPSIEDVIPPGMRGGGIAGISTTSISVGGSARTPVDPVVAPGTTFATDGQVDWVLPSNAGGGANDYTIGPGEQMVITYTVNVDADIGADRPLPNAAKALEWFSFDDGNPPGAPGATTGPARREYGPSNTSTVNLRSSQPTNVLKNNPVPANATVGETYTYTIQVPADPAALDVSIYDAVITDDLPPEVTFVGGSFTGGGATGTPQFNYDATGNTLTIQDPTNGIDIAPGNSAQFDVTVRVNNTTAENAGDAITNTARYVYSSIDDDGTAENSGGPDVTTPPMTLQEPLVTPAKDARNVTAGDTFGGGFTAPDAGDVVEYRLQFTAASGVDRSEAYDLGITDTLPAGTQFVSGSAAFGPGSSTIGPAADNALNDPAVSGQTLNWTYAAGNDVDIAPGETVSIVYRVRVADSVAPLTQLTNSAVVTWTSLDGETASELPYQRNHDAATDPPNDYRATIDHTVTSADTTQVAKVEASTPPLGDGGDGDGNYRLGERVTYRVEITQLTEGTLDNFVVTDTLPVGLDYEGGSATVTQGGTAISPDPGGSPDPSVSSSGSQQTLTWDFGDLVNQGEAPNGSNDSITIEYSAIVRADAPATEDATNDVNVSYLDGSGNPIDRTASTPIDIVVPAFDTVDKSTTVPTAPSTVDAGTTVPYTVTLTNTGGAPGYDLTVQDVIPDGMRAGALAAGQVPATVSVTDSSGATVFGPQPVNGTFPSDFANDGIVQWTLDFGSDDAIPAGGTVTLQYNVDIDDDVGPGVTLENLAGGLQWFTLDTEASPPQGTPVQRGPGPTDSVTLLTPTPGPMSKVSTTVVSTMGDQIVYRLRVPDATFGAALYDVLITDQLPPEVEFLSAAYGPGNGVTEPLQASVDGGNVLTLTSGTDPDGLDIPAGQVAVIDVTVRHNDSGGGNAGDTYTNSASYTWERLENGTDDLTGGPPVGHSIDVIEPNLVVNKAGDATIDRTGASFTITAENTGEATAHDVIITDVLPPEMRDTQPVIDNVQVTGPGGTRALGQGSDYLVSWDGATGRLVLTFESPNAALAGASPPGSGETLQIDYTGFLDVDTPDGVTLDNVAGATRWATQDGSGGVFPPDTRVYAPALTNGTPGTADAQDDHSIDVEAPIIDVLKSVDRATALPGQVLTYTITVNNTGSGDGLVDIVDDLGALDTDDVYVPGSLTIVTPPASFGTNATDAGGGTAGKGLVDFRDVVVPAGGSATVVFSVDSRPVVSDGDHAVNQGRITVAGFSGNTPTDDPATGAADDPTQTVFGAQPDVHVEKVDRDVTGDPNVLVVGDTLEYTITVTNVGTENVINTVLTDAVPGNTTYVPGSTTLNGNPIADVGGSGNPRTPLEDGLTINDAASGPGVIGAMNGAAATIVFRVTVDDGLLQGTVLSNQATLTAEGSGSGTVPTVPSDDPDTPIVGDPTQSIVGAAPLVDVQKSVSSSTDPVLSGPPTSSELTYTITISNNGTAPATGTVLTDEVPAGTAYVGGSTELNGVAVPDATGGTAPFTSAAGGLPVSSSDLVPPGALPTATQATLSAGESATVTFHVTVNSGLSDGTVISNQGTVRSDRQPDEPTDADGNDENGDQPTTVIVGGQPRLSIAKEVFVVGGGTVAPDGLLDYVVRVENVGPVDATGVTITDDLDAPVPGQLAYIPGSGRLDGVAGPVTFADPVLTANVGTLAAGDTTVLRFRVRVDASLAAGTSISNTARVTANGGVDETGSVAIDVGGAPGVANLNGRVWLDDNLDDAFDAADERPLQGWRVAVSFNGNTIGAVDSANDGTFALRGLAPGGDYTLTFTYPGQTTTFGDTAPTLGMAGRQVITAIAPVPGANVVGEDMPVTANGTVYESVARTPVGGATLHLLDTATGQAVAAGCFDDSTQQGQVTPNNGLYLFELNFSDPSCPAPGDYLLQVTPPANGYGPAPSRIIPPTTDGTTAPYDVSTCANDAIPPGPPGDLCQAQPQDTPPPTSVPVGSGTRYYLNLTFSGGGNAAQMHNHHVPLDPELGDAVALTKTTPMVNVVRGQLVPYTITATNRLGGPLTDSVIVDTIPPGFKYVEGSATVAGTKEEPDVDGRQLVWQNITLPNDEPLQVKVILVVGGGVGEGEYVNRARVRNASIGAPASREASATVRVVPDPTFDCTDVIGKVYDDRNANGHQDDGEPGLPGVRLTTVRGLLIRTDAYGRYHVTCAAVPDRDRGSNFIIKLDERTLPSGYRTTTENPRVVRATRGKMVRANFGATIHRVVRLDLAGPAFVPAKTALRPEWRGKLEPLFKQLDKGPSVLRISYLGDTESQALAQARLDAIADRIQSRWSERDGAYDLRIETELFWRRGRPGGSQ